MAKKSDSKFIEELYKEYDFKLQPSWIKYMAIAEDENSNPIAVMSLNTILECCFLTVKNSTRKNRIKALKRLVELGVLETKLLGYDGAHGFSNKEIAPILKKHFGFVPGKGENLFLSVE